jgi:NTP pyrophosphatase (non-canonical NTP hydrolase)
MELNDYQIKSRKTALYPNVGNNFIYPTLGLCGETGEVAEKIKKIIRDNNSIADLERINDIKKELGDVM